MKKTILPTLCCPNCRKHFRSNVINLQSADSIIYGSVLCKCDEYPIIEGILILDRTHSKPIIDKLRKGKNTQALILILGIQQGKHLGFIRKYYELLVGFILNKLSPDSKNTWHFYLTWRFLFRRSRSEYNYFFQRNLEEDSLLFFLPLAYAPKKQLVWLDVGSGINNYYEAAQKISSKISFYSVDISFLNLFLNNKLFQKKNTAFICSDICTGTFLTIKCDIVTFIDTLQCIPYQIPLLTRISHDILNKSGILLGSAIPEHIYIKDNHDYYPLHRSLVINCFPARLYNHHKITKAILSNTNPESAEINEKTLNISRYTFLYNKNSFLKWKGCLLPDDLTQNTKYFWSPNQPEWSNDAY